VGGLKVNPEEVEAVINRHPQVRMSLAQVVLREEPQADGAEARMGALRGEILDLCRDRLARHKVPAMIRFVPALRLRRAASLNAIMPDSDKRTVVVTGGSRGLGLATARRLTAAGYGVVAVARKMRDQLSAAIQETGNAGTGSLDFVAYDLGETEGIPKLARTLRKQFGAVYGLVNNAAVATDGPLANMKNSQIEELLRVNTLAPIMLSKYVVRSMMADGGGRIVNMASVVGFTGYSGLSVYGATKASMIGFTRSLAREVGRLGINVNAVAPGSLDTAMTQGMEDDQRQKVARRSALRRLADPTLWNSCWATRQKASPAQC
jgi:3-oxoacyl-[acyl-carrier protein] reductase